MGIYNLTEKRVKNMKEPAVSDHRLQCDCVLSFDNFDVLASTLITLDCSSKKSC